VGKVIFMENHRPTCSVEGCASPAYTRSSGLCIMHYARMKKHGSTDDPRPERFGEKLSHPLRARWALLKRRHLLCPEWMDFWGFVDGVSPQPANSKKLARPDENAPFGPNNFLWTKTPTRDEKLAYHREYNQKNPHKRRSKHLADSYDLTIEQYAAMHTAQEGKCAICRREEKTRNRVATGDMRLLAVDHDHTTGKVRALLCGDCNRGLGMFGDDPARLFAAIQYLAKWGKVSKVS
jgi:Recombination endonuclease VII